MFEWVYCLRLLYSPKWISHYQCIVDRLDSTHVTMINQSSLLLLLSLLHSNTQIRSAFPSHINCWPVNESGHRNLLLHVPCRSLPIMLSHPLTIWLVTFIYHSLYIFYRDVKMRHRRFYSYRWKEIEDKVNQISVIFHNSCPPNLSV